MKKDKKNKNYSDPQLFWVSLKTILRNKKGEILVLKCPKTSSMPGYYDFPGGRIDPDELKIPFEKIIKRELAEEIGKSVKFSLLGGPVSIGRHSAFSKKRKKIIHIFFVFFEGIYLGGKIKISKEHTSYKWLRTDNKKTISKYFLKGIKEGFVNYLAWKQKRRDNINR